MEIKTQIKRCIKGAVIHVPFLRNAIPLRRLYRKYSRVHPGAGFGKFLKSHAAQLYNAPPRREKAERIAELLRHVNIRPVDNGRFFYSLDPYKTATNQNDVYGNCTADIGMLVQSDWSRFSLPADSDFARGEQTLIMAMKGYLDRCQKDPTVAEKYKKQLLAIGSLFERPANSLFEALQRILFYNQFLWQTGHTLNGLGHLDWILADLYEREIEEGTLTREGAKELLKDFFCVLHENYWFKSAVLMGDTGQIVILGGRDEDGRYRCNDLTFLFIEISKELRLPDPKVLLRCTADMPEDLLALAVDCIATGIGAPLLSNDDAVIPAMVSCGYEEQDAFHYGVSACWEPLVPGFSFDPNNIASLNFAVPFTHMAASAEFDSAETLEAVLSLYENALKAYIRELLTPLTKKAFEEDPLLSLASPSCQQREKDITRGGAQYSNMGLTSVGLGCVVNSLLNLNDLVFTEKRFSLRELNGARKANFAGQDDLVREMKERTPGYGSDDAAVVGLSRRLIQFVSEEFKKYKTPYGGVFKFGLSSPSYITGAGKVPATFDGRRDGEPFGVHISSAQAVPTTELLSFAAKMDYRDNRLNGNVIDFIVSPGMLSQNRQKYTALLRSGFANGIFQLQMNVVDSKTLIAAKADPTLFPNLVVRVWGFSAYFNDLPEEYKDVLIARAIESERAA